MLIDVHTHHWNPKKHLTEDFRTQAGGARNEPLPLETSPVAYNETAPTDTVRIVFGGQARLAGIWVDNDFVAGFVAQEPDRRIGFLSVDPTQPDWKTELERAHKTLGLKGIKLLPMYAGFRPDEPFVDPLWDYAQANNLPVLLHTGTTFVRQAPLDCTYPRYLDTVAIRFPGVRIVMAHLGHPFEGECLAVIRKHPHVYADISALHYRPFQLYHSLMLAQEYGVERKILFGSDFPFTTVNASIEGLKTINRRVHGDALPPLSTKMIDGMLERDSPTLLGLS